MLKKLLQLFNRESDDSNSIDPTMKYLIVGLGNPGAEYHNNRHNIGFLILNQMAEKKEKEFESNKLGYTLKLRHRGKILHLLKPTTFMNLSGKAVRYHLQQNKIPVENLLVLVDDLALPFGKQRLRGKGGAGGHNGLTDIETALGTQVYARLRFGVGSEFAKGKQVNYVLADFPPEEAEKLPELMDKSIKVIEDFVSRGLNQAMTAHNKS